MRHAVHAAAFRPRYPAASLGEAAQKAVEAAATAGK